MKKMSLTISERTAALSILNQFKGNLETMATILEDIKQLPIEEAEWEKAGKTETTVGTNIHWNWSDELGGEKEIELQKTTLDYIKAAIKEKDEKKELTLKSEDRALVSLNNKL